MRVNNIYKLCISVAAAAFLYSCSFLDVVPPETEALEPMLSRNIIKLQITDNHILSKAQSKSKSF